MPGAKKILFKNEFFLKNSGKSMMPILLPGDVIKYKKVPFKKLRLDDIVLVKKGENLFTHRVIYQSKNYLITRGDNNFLPDGKIYPENVLARGIYYIRNGKTLDIESVYFLQSSLYYEEIVKLNKDFLEAGVDFVFLKGLPVYFFYGKTHPRRLYNDCDILLNRLHLKTVLGIMKKNGYQSCDSPLSKIQGHINDYDVALCFGKLINGFVVVIDIHLDVDFLMTQLSRLDSIFPSKVTKKLTGSFLRNKRRVSVKNHSFYILSPVHLILNLCLHFFKHNFRGFDRIYFISQVIRKEKPKNKQLLNEVAEEINRYHLENFIYPVLVIMNRFFSDILTKQDVRKVSPQKDKLIHIKKRTENDLFTEEPRITAGIERFKNLFFLSPNPIGKKLFVFIDPQVILALLTVLTKKLLKIFGRSLAKLCV